MPVKVVDASAIGTLLFGEPEAVFVSAALKNTKMVSPSPISLEVTSICLEKIRRQSSQPAMLRNAFRFFFNWISKSMSIVRLSCFWPNRQDSQPMMAVTYAWPGNRERIF